MPAARFCELGCGTHLLPNWPLCRGAYMSCIHVVHTCPTYRSCTHFLHTCPIRISCTHVLYRCPTSRFCLTRSVRQGASAATRRPCHVASGTTRMTTAKETAAMTKSAKDRMTKSTVKLATLVFALVVDETGTLSVRLALYHAAGCLPERTHRQRRSAQA